MFRWLANWFTTRARRRKRNLFRFFDGRQFVQADPWPIYRKVYNDSEFLIGRADGDPTDMLQAAVELEEPEFSKAVRCVHRAFGTQPFDPKTNRGLTETEAFALLIDFMEWCVDLVKKNGGLPSLSPSTDSESSTSQDSPDEPTRQPSPSSSSPELSQPCEAVSSSTE